MSPLEPSSVHSAAVNCARMKELGYFTGKHMDLYGEHIQLVSDPFEEGGGVAVRVVSGNDPRVKTVELPTSILMGWEDLFKEPASPAASELPAKTLLS